MAGYVNLLVVWVAVVCPASGESLQDACLPVIQAAMNVIKENMEDLPEELSKAFKNSGFFEDDLINREKWMLLFSEMYYGASDMTDDGFENMIEDFEPGLEELEKKLEDAMQSLAEKDIQKCAEKFTYTMNKMSEMIF